MGTSFELTEAGFELVRRRRYGRRSLQHQLLITFSELSTDAHKLETCVNILLARVPSRSYKTNVVRMGAPVLFF